MHDIKFVGIGLTDVPSLLPVMRKMGVDELYTDGEVVYSEVYTSFGLKPRKLELLDKNDLIVGAWSPTQNFLHGKDFKHFIFMIHGVCNFCGCLGSDVIPDRYELVAGDVQRNYRIKNGKNPNLIFTVGYPKIDELAKHPEIDLELRERILGNTEQTILWAPPGHDTYVTEIMPILGEFKQRNPKVNIILKLHGGGIHHTLFRYNARLTSDIMHIMWDDDYTTDPLLRISDVVLSGHSSVIYESVLTDRPIISCALQDRDKIRDHRDLIQLEKEELLGDLEEALRVPDDYINKKNRYLMRRELFKNIGCATEAAVAQIEEIQKWLT